MLSKLMSGLLLPGLFWFGAFSASPHYQLKSYSIGPGGTNTAQSTTYRAQASVGEQSNNSTKSTNYTANNGSIQTEQLNAPPAPTLSNGANSYYNQLGIIINTGNNPSDSTYAVAVSTNNFTSTSYVQLDGSLGSQPFYQSYIAWGGATGSFIVGLTPSTNYQVKVAAMEGQFTNTNFGSSASISTVSPAISFSLSGNSLNLGNLLPGTINTSPVVSVNISTNANYGGSVYVSGVNQGLKSLSANYLLPSLTGNLSSFSEGFGIQAQNPNQSSGGPITILSPYNVTGSNVGNDLNVPQQVLNSSSPVVAGSAAITTLAKDSPNSPAASDYQEVLNFIAAANY